MGKGSPKKAGKKVTFRNPVYIAYMVAGCALFLVSALIASSGSGTLETSLFRLINELPDQLQYLFVFISLFGTIGFVIVLSLLSAFFKHYKAAVKFLLAGGISYELAYGLKHLAIRARPEVVLDNVNLREVAAPTFGFPSGHAAVATAVALIAFQYTPKRLHKYISFTVLGVLLSRLYLGVHLPMDLVGGFAVGLTAGSAISYLFGRSIIARVTVKEVTDALHRMNFPVATVKVLGVDARGSSPFIVTDTHGKNYFLKVVNSDNFIADWLFKSWRKVIYRRLEDEYPFFSPKRQIEHESYVAGLAYSNGIRTPRVVSVIEVKPNNWAQIQEAIDGKSLDKVKPELITDQVLNKVFALIQELHEAHIIHRDLRSANIFLDTKKQPWLIDFGFSEASVHSSQTYRDIVELLASLSVLVGAERTVAAALKNIPKKQLIQAVGYLNFPALSSETTRLLKKKKQTLPKLKKLLMAELELQKVKPVRVERFDMKKIAPVVGIVLFAFFIFSQHGDLDESVHALRHASIKLVALSLLFSACSYLAAAMVYKLIAVYHLSYTRTLLVQSASSFTNRLLPAGTGGIATFTRYLVKEGHSLQQSAAIASVNNIIGFIAISSLTLLVAIASHTPLRDAFHIEFPSWILWTAGIVLVLMVALLVAWKQLRQKAYIFARSIAKDFKLIAADPVRLVTAIFFSMLITISYAAVLYVSIHAMGQSATILQTFIVLTVGVAAASITPTPGGVGGAEAGLVAGLSSIGIPASIGLGIALLYRLATFWLPIIPGIISFRFALRKNIL